MKAVAPRIERLYESEVERWRTAWERFLDSLWGHLSYDEQRAYDELHGLAPNDDVNAEMQEVLDRWSQELLDETGEHELEALDTGEFVDAYFDRFWDAVPSDLDVVDLMRWPAGVPWPPHEDPAKALEYEMRLQRLCRRDKGEGRAERLAAVYILFIIAVYRTARLYSKEKQTT